MLTFVGWIDQKSTNWFKARSEAMRMVKNALETNGYSLPEPIYRLRFDDGDLQQAFAGAAGTPEPRTAEPPRRQPEPETPQNTDVDTALLRRMDRERRTKGRGDLLNENAPNEFGDDEA